MKLASTLALLLLAACATTGARPEEARPRPELVPVSRAMTAIDAAERKGDIAAHRSRWSQAAQAAPRDPAPQFLAVYAEPAGDERWAEFKAMTSAFPDSALGYVGMARIYVGWKTLDQADRAIVHALDLEPDCWLAVLVRAEVAERRGRLEASAADYRAVVAADPSNAEAHLGLARVARASGDLARAAAEATAALKAFPDLYGAFALLGELAASADDVERAADLWAGAVDASPRDRVARVTLARLLQRKGDAAGASAQWKVAVDLHEDAESLVSLAQVARASGDVATEQRALERISAVDPSAAEWRRIAELRLAAKDLDGAEKAFRRALARDPHDAEASLGLGRIHAARGDVQEAVEALRAAGPAARADLEALEARLHLEKLGRPDVTGLQKAVQGLVDRTYRARLSEAPSLSGTLRLRVTADVAGAATLVEVLEDSVHDADVRACAYWNLRDAAYPPNKPGRYSFTFAFRR